MNVLLEVDDRKHVLLKQVLVLHLLRHFSEKTDLNTIDNDSVKDGDSAEPQVELNDFVRKEPRTKEIRKWTVVDEHQSTNYHRPITKLYVNTVPMGEWNDLSPAQIFLMQLLDKKIET